MHELGIAMEVIERATARAGDERIVRITLRVGQLAAVLPESLVFCFDLAAAGTRAEGAELCIVTTPGLARCTSCGEQLTLDRPFGRCGCGSSELDWISGDELEIVDLEVN